MSTQPDWRYRMTQGIDTLPPKWLPVVYETLRELDAIGALVECCRVYFGELQIDIDEATPAEIRPLARELAWAASVRCLSVPTSKRPRGDGRKRG